MKQAVCPACSTANRIGDRDAHAAKCGRCGQRLFTGAPIDVDDQALQSHVKMTAGPVLVDVWAPWCGPCRAMAPHFAEAALRFEPSIRFLKINADQNKAPAQMGVRGIPTLILFRDGTEIARRAGLMTADQLGVWLKQALPSIKPMEMQK